VYGPSNERSCVLGTDALAPLLISTVSNSIRHVTLTWSEHSSQGQGWPKIVYGTTPGHYTATAYPTSSADNQTYTVAGLKSGTTYYFAIVFVENGSGTTHLSNVQSAKVQ